ncbi:hypothetical protein DB346_02870 [Verrucomicrobia bacterium LW23]|nr:hypothetical protein DB346_03785 [Verrucomicrobia bacterium LW23]PTY04391.1 hypothetical protein DB346_02870 [Verrucomicrobia bacterium LW23]
MKLLSFNFPYSNLPVRSCTIDGKPWFVAIDVCRILDIRNNRDAISDLEPDEVCMMSLSENTVGNADGIPPHNGTGRGNPNVNLVSESGVYALVFKSRKEAARRFRVWITSEVLPSIRERGYYSVFGSEEDAELARLEAKVTSQMSHIRQSVENLREPLPEGYATIASHLRGFKVDLSKDPSSRLRLAAAVKALATAQNVRIIPLWAPTSWRAVNCYPRHIVKEALSSLSDVEVEPDFFDFL